MVRIWGDAMAHSPPWPEHATSEAKSASCARCLGRAGWPAGGRWRCSICGLRSSWGKLGSGNPTHAPVWVGLNENLVSRARDQHRSRCPTIPIYWGSRPVLPPRFFRLVLVQTTPNKYAQWIHRPQLALGQQWYACGAVQWPTARSDPSMRPARPNPRSVLGASGEPAGRLGGAGVARYANYGRGLRSS